MSILPFRGSQIAAFVALDVLAVGAGMGVPIFAILLGFPVGWVLPALLKISSPYPSNDLRLVLRSAAATAAITFAMMALIWLPTLRTLARPAADIANFGIPMVLYEPVPSFIGWIVLMVVVSPFLQMLTTLFGAVLRCTSLATQAGAIALGTPTGSSAS
jgi:hypothetical protein